MKRVIALHFDHKERVDGCQLYRVNQPLYHLGQHGWDTTVDEIPHFAKLFKKHGRGVWFDLVDQHDLFIFPRASYTDDIAQNVYALMYLIRLLGKRSIYEVDDDYTGIHRDLTPLGVFNAMKFAKYCDAVTVTTPQLSKLMNRQTHLPTYILPNMLDPLIWKRPEKRIAANELVIGLSGSMTHYQDWQVVAEPLRRILSNQYDIPVSLWVTGFVPGYLQDFPNTTYYPGLEYKVYAEMVRGCDIVLAPVDPNDPFNLGKSPIKVLEGMGSSRPIGNTVGGAACIATNNPIYQLAIEDGKSGLLVEHNENSWYTALDTLIQDHALRHTLSVEGHTRTWKRHDITEQWKLWARAYTSVLNKPQNPLPLPYSPE